MPKHPYSYQTANHDASIETWMFDEMVCIDAAVGQLVELSLEFDAETAWKFANDVIAAAREASPELISAFEAQS